MSSEKAAHGRFRAKLNSRFNRINRVENLIVPGMPDVNCCFKGVGEFWIEIKTPTEPVRESTPLMGSNHKLEQVQINWHLQQHQCGGKSYVLVDTDKSLILFPGHMVEDFNKLTVKQMIAESYFYAPKPMDKRKWNKLKSVLGC